MPGPVLGAALVAQGWAGLLVPMWADGRGFPYLCPSVWTIRVPHSSPHVPSDAKGPERAGDPCWL